MFILLRDVGGCDLGGGLFVCLFGVLLFGGFLWLLGCWGDVLCEFVCCFCCFDGLFVVFGWCCGVLFSCFMFMVYYVVLCCD